jgi:hypothetical protein
LQKALPLAVSFRFEFLPELSRKANAFGIYFRHLAAITICGTAKITIHGALIACNPVIDQTRLKIEIFKTAEAPEAAGREPRMFSGKQA